MVAKGHSEGPQDVSFSRILLSKIDKKGHI